MQTTPNVYCISTSYLDGFSGYSASDEKTMTLLERLRFLGAEEAVILNTCNRFEIYFASSREAAEKIIRRFKGRVFKGAAANRHALRVAAGLESMLPGEKQILEQVKDAYRFSRDAGYASDEMRRIFMVAHETGKKIRAKAGFPSLSLGKAAVDYANSLEGLAGKKIFVLGAGKMGSEIALALERNNIKDFVVSSRTLKTAKDVGCGKPVEFGEMMKTLGTADILFVAASCPMALLKYDDIKLGENRKISIFDISAPAAVEGRVASLGNVRYRGMGELKKFIDDTKEYMNFASRAEKILEAGKL